MTERPATPATPETPGTPETPERPDGTQTTTDSTEKTTMTGPQTPEQPSTRPDPTLSTQLGWPDATTSVPVEPTSALPLEQAPFRVEPATPVPDDATNPDDANDELPHLPPPNGPAAHPSGPVPAGHPAPTPPARPLVTVRTGPRPGTVVLGLLALLVSGYVLVGNLTDADLSLRLVGAPLVGAFGGVLLLVGLAGVLAGRLRRR